MESCLLDLVKNEVQSLVNLVKNEAQYLCCFNSYVENFEQKKNILTAKHKDVKTKFQKGKGVFSFKFEAQQWEHEADDIILIDTKIKKNFFFVWCPNCWWKYRRGKELAKKTQHIENLLQRCNSNIVAGRANVLDIKYLSSQGFIHFESRESKFQDLLKALQDENYNMIGLQGLGGTGKTSMAKEVGHKLMKESKLIDKVIFLVVSQPPNFRKIRGELAKSLDLNLDEVKEEELSSTIFSKITHMDQKLLIILDDVWVKFDLTEELGIPQKGCNLLITTRNLDVCTKMKCQTIQLHILTNEEALNLFKAHANNSSRGFKGMPQKIVKHCGGVPVAIVALASSLKNQPISVWKDALKTLEDGGHDPTLEEAYKCLKLSCDNLKSQKAKELLLISSLFPEDFEIPIDFLIKICIGLGSFNENDEYHLIRREVHGAIMELIHSSLLMNDEEECVKMHDLVREVALRIGENDMQSLLDLKKPIKRNLRYLLWSTDKFPNEIDGNKLEYLSIFLHDSKGFNVTDTFFKEMTSIKVLILANDKRGPAVSLTNSLQPLKSIQTLILFSMELGDISVLKSLLALITLWLFNCSIIELPKEFSKLKKLRSLEVQGCEIKMNNPFEVIEMCSQLEELTFVGNKCDDEEKDAISHNGSPLKLHRYWISSEDDLSNYFEKYGSKTRCFLADELINLVSHSTFKKLVERAEVLSLEGEDEVLSSGGDDEVLSSEGEDGQRMWKNLVPDVVPIDKEGVMNDLIVLHLSSYANMECLIDTKDHDPSMSAFCNVAELHLSEMGIEDLCRGPPPSGFLEQLEILKLTNCHKLKSVLFNANYNLCHLESMELEDCSKLMSVFQPYTTRSLIQLKKLTIKNCGALEYIIVGKDGDSIQKNYYESLFPSLEELELSGVPSFIGIVREYHQLMSSSMHKQSHPLSRHNSRNLNQSLATSAFSWVQACCSLNKLRPVSKETSITSIEDRSLDHTNPPKLDTSIHRGAPSLTAQSLMLQSLKNVRKITLVRCHNIISLSTLSIATSTIALETLTIWGCRKLKCITTHEGDAQVDRNNCSIFPTLEKLEIKFCEELEFLFVSPISVGLQKLKSLTIDGVPKLKCVFGSYQKEQHSSNQDQNDELHFDLPALKTLSITYAPKINDIFANNYSMVNWTATEEVRASTIGAPLFNVTQNLFKNIREIELQKCTLTTLSIASIILLEVLTIRECGQLKCIVGDEGDARIQINYNPIFPKLRRLDVSYCDTLEYLFAAYAFRSPVYLESLKISHAPMLKYVFGRSQHDDSLNHENQNIQTLIDFPALKDLSIENVPKLVSIYPENYYMRELYLRSVVLKTLPQFIMKPFNGFLVCWHTEQQKTKVIEMCCKTLESLQVCDFKIEEIFHLTFMETEKKRDELQPLTSSLQDFSLLNLSGSVNICVGPKCIIRFDSLRDITIKTCKKLKVIFSASIVRSLPMLCKLDISGCEELVHIVEEDYETNAVDHVRHEPCFPNLFEVSVSECDKLKYLFSITISDILPKLQWLVIDHAYELEHVLIKRDGMEEIVMKDVLPQLRHLILVGLPNLISVCYGVNFQKEDYSTYVDNCPKFGTSITQHQADLESRNSQVEEKAEESLSSHMGEETTQQSFTEVVEARAKGVSTSLNQAPSSILSKSSDDDDVQVYAKSHPHPINLFGVVDHGDIKEAVMVQNENNSNVETISLTRREQESSYSKGQIKTKDQLTDSQPMSAMPTTPFVTISQDEHSQILDVKGEEGALILATPHPSSLTSKEEPIPMSLNSTSLSRSPSTTVRIFEEEEKGGLTTTSRHESDTKVVSSLPPGKEHKTSNQGDPFVPPMPVISSEFAECGSSEIASSICDIKNALSVAGVKEIVNMMKLEGVEPSMLTEAFKTKPQLSLSSEDRSTELLCYSYRVLLNILNILTTRSPFTITEADKILLAKNLKDAYVLGFDKDWLESIRIKVFNCDASEFHHKQQVLQSLGNKLEANKRELANVRNQEAKATQSVEMAQKELEATHKELEEAYKGLEAAQSHLNVAQQEHAKIRVHHSKLLEECQEIIEQRDQCSEIIASTLRPFGF